ncbi:MAG: ABC transporter permease [Dehalobacterium sp.]
MALKQNKYSELSGSIYFAALWIMFAVMILFLLLVIIGLCSFSDLDTFINILKHPEFHFSIKFTLWTSLLAILFAVLFALPCGYIMSRYRLPGSAFLEVLIDIPIVLPPLVSGIALMIFFGPFLGESLAQVGINVVFTPLGVIVAQWFIATPFAIKSFKQAFSAIDQRMERVANTLGFSPPMVFLMVTLPLAKNGLMSGTMMAWTRALGEFGATAMLAGITRMKTETLSVAVFLNMSIGDIKFAISAAIVMLLLALVLLILIKAFLRNEVRV